MKKQLYGIKIGFEKLASGRFKGTYQVSEPGDDGIKFPLRKTFGTFVDANAAKVGATIDANIAIAQGIFVPSIEDLQRKRFQESQAKRDRAAQDLKEHIKREVKKKLMRLAHSL
jgi:hypothetical protein